MTLVQKMQDERMVGFTEGFRYAVIALKDELEPSVIAKRFNLPLDKIMEILEDS